MRLEQLQYVVAVADAQQINAAANAMFVTPQNISKTIKQLENELGIAIFDRTKYGMFLTDDGQLLYNVAHDVIRQVDYLESVFKNKSCFDDEEIEGQLCIVASSAVASVLYTTIRSLVKRYSKLQTTVIEQGTNETIRLLSEPSGFSEADFIFLSGTQATLDRLRQSIEPFDAYLLSTERTCVLMSTKSQYANQQSISLKTLEKLPIAGFGSFNLVGNEKPSFLMNLIEDFGAELNMTYISNSQHTWYSYIYDGLAYGVVGSNFTRNFLDERSGGGNPGTVTVPLEEEISALNIVLVPKSKPETPQMARFFEELRNRYSDTMRKL